jgi:hypothetical protein
MLQETSNNFRVDFMIVGAAKCGTTSLAYQLAQHPDICFSKVKEPNYFLDNHEGDWERSLDRYHNLYHPSPGQLCGESSVTYTNLPGTLGTHRRLFDYNPKLKLIYIMRQPIERMISHYMQNSFKKDRTDESIDVAICRNPVYVNRSRYAVQISPYIELFGREKILLLIFEDYISDPLRTLEKIIAFLGISDVPHDIDLSLQNKSVGTTKLSQPAKSIRKTKIYKVVAPLVPRLLRTYMKQRMSQQLLERPKLSQELRRTLWLFVEDDVKRIEKLVGRRLDEWYPEGYSRKTGNNSTESGII